MHTHVSGIKPATKNAKVVPCKLEEHILSLKEVTFGLTTDKTVLKKVGQLIDQINSNVMHMEFYLIIT